MTTAFHDDLAELKKDVFDMGVFANEMLRDSMTALKDQNVELADRIAERKIELAEMDFEIEERALRLITLNQPMGSDMRTIAACLKIITYVARIGRYGKDIAQMAKDLSEDKRVAKLVSMPHMTDIVCGMIDEALTAFHDEEVVDLKKFEEKEDEVDALRYSIFRECITYMMEDQKNITRCMHYVMIARYLERCADHSCKIAEKVHYMVTGEHIEIK